MAGFSKRPKRRNLPHTEKKFELPKDDAEDIGSYITSDYADDDEDDDDFDYYGDKPDLGVKNRKKSAKKVIYDDDDLSSRKKKKPNIFIRALRAIFPVKGDGVGESVRKVIFDIAVVAFVITGGSVLWQIGSEFINQQKDVEIRGDYQRDVTADKEMTPQELSGVVNIPVKEIERILEEKPEIQPSFLKLYSENSDIVGWVSLGSKDDRIVFIDYPVVQAADNDYYLTHNFKKENAERGAIFADYRNVFEPDRLSANTILYGHNMWNGDTMFAKLSRYYEPNPLSDPAEYKNDPLRFYREHPTVTFNTLYENSEWKVFACVLFNTQEELGEVYPYLNYRDLPSKDAFNSFILDIMDRSVLWTDVDLKYGDEILTLSTCYYPYTKEVADTRVAVFARKVRANENESAEVDVSKAQRNPDPLKFRFQYERDGGTWGGRKWDSSKLLSY